jgi:hypothetical protein
MKRFKVTTTEGQIYFIFADSLEAAWENWFQSYGRALTAQSMVEQK